MDGEKMIWIEKYRPNRFNDILGQDIEKIKELVKDPTKMPHFLFVSRSPGTGKTSMTYVIKNEIGCPDSDFLILNSSDERKIETIRTKVKDFARTRRKYTNIPKIIVMDEFDGVLETTQNAMRTLMETYHSNCRFILTANHEEKIIDPIKSRCAVFRFREISKEQIIKRLTEITKKEGLIISNEDLIGVIDKYYPDMRSMINCLQRGGDIKTQTLLEDEFYKILKKSESGYSARKFAIENGLDPQNLLKRTLENILNDKPNAYDRHPNLKNIVWDTAEYNYRMAVGADSEIQLFAWILKIKEVI
jgi:replication factor C small subunit